MTTCSVHHYHAILLGRDRYFRAEIDFEIDAATPGSIEDAADEQADQYAEVLMRECLVGRVEIDSVYETAGAPLTVNLAYDAGDLVPGWHDSPEGRADAADQARWDRQETRRNG